MDINYKKYSPLYGNVDGVGMLPFYKSNQEINVFV